MSTGNTTISNPQTHLDAIPGHSVAITRTDTGSLTATAGPAAGQTFHSTKIVATIAPVAADGSSAPRHRHSATARVATAEFELVQPGRPEAETNPFTHLAPTHEDQISPTGLLIAWHRGKAVSLTIAGCDCGSQRVTLHLLSQTPLAPDMSTLLATIAQRPQGVTGGSTLAALAVQQAPRPVAG